MSKSVAARKPESGAPVGKATAGNQAAPVRPATDGRPGAARKPGVDQRPAGDRKSGGDQKVPPNRKPGGNSKERAFPFEGDNFDQLLSANLAESDSGAPVDEEELAPAKREKPKAKKKKPKPAKVAKPARRSAAVDGSEMLQGILYLILGGCFLFGSFYLYNELDEWEKHGEGPKRMNRIVVVAYQIGGKTGATVASFCLGLWIIYISIRQLRGQASGGE
ncbi:MAG: hypothetical protein U0903_05860 [Planctomycetales bacterium]